MIKLSKKKFVVGLVLLLVLVISFSSLAENHPLKGKKIKMSILGIGGWVPSKLGVEMSPLFADYARENYGYEVSFTFQSAPFSSLFQKAATSLATRSQEYNIIISDSQWLGAFAEPGWITNLNNIIKENPELSKIEWFDPIVKKAYMTYPDGTNHLWGLPQEGDVLVLYVRKDMLHDLEERIKFKKEYGYEMPETFEDFKNITMEKYIQMCEFFNRPDEKLYGVAIQYSKEYDYMTGSLYPFMWSMGGQIWDEETKNVWGVLNTPTNVKALETMVSLQKYAPPGVTNYGIGEITDAFTTGKVFSAFQWAAVGEAMIPSELEGKVMAVPPPGFMVDGKINRVYSIGGQPWVINKYNDEEHMRVAIDFLKWWYKKETQLEFAKRGGDPVTKAAVESEDFENIQPWFRAYKYMLTEERSRDFWHEPKYAEMLSLQQAAFTAYATGEVDSAKKVLDYVAYHQQKILFEAGRTDTPPPDIKVELK